MSKAVRTTLSILISLALFGVVAQAGGNKQRDNANNKPSHSRFAKFAFWRHHRNGDKNVKLVQAKPAHSKQPQPTAALVKPSPAKPAAGRSKDDQKQALHAGNLSKNPAQKASVAKRTKPQNQAQDGNTSSFKE